MTTITEPTVNDEPESYRDLEAALNELINALDNENNPDTRHDIEGHILDVREQMDNYDLSNDDLFICTTCKTVMDIEDSVKIDTELHCTNCKQPQNNDLTLEFTVKIQYALPVDAAFCEHSAKENLFAALEVDRQNNTLTPMNISADWIEVDLAAKGNNFIGDEEDESPDTHYAICIPGKGFLRDVGKNVGTDGHGRLDITTNYDAIWTFAQKEWAQQTIDKEPELKHAKIIPLV